MAQDRAQRPTGGPIDGPPGGGPHGGPQASLPSIRGGTYFLGRYRVVDEIGIGGMASVHLARMDGPGGFQKWVAIKRIHPHLVEDDTFVHMFLDEARVAARISHPNVATVFELGKHEDTYWIAMEYLHGEPLREVMRRTEELGQPMPPEIACRVIADAAEGLHAAHELLGKNGEKLGLVHRDVTPHNLFVTYDGNTKVVDFGIAKFSSRMASTRAGTLKGKLAYMSPEQVQGEQIDRRTDIFALGVVLWELTTGQRLFRMESDLDTLAKVQECNVPRPSSIVRGYPIDLEKIVMKALAKNKNERFRTARELSRALQSLLMRRGLFVASDEVAAYTQAIFQDRIRKREAHLRWAAEVTQTINIENHVAVVQSPSEHFARQEPSASFASDVQPSPPATNRPGAGGGAGGVPRPAAGAPPPPSNRPAATTNRPGAMGQGHGQVSASTMSAQSAPTNARPGALVETVRPPPRFQMSAPPPSRANVSANAPADAGHPANDELNTIRASPQAMGGFADIEGDDFDDTDDTIVTTGRVEFADGIAHFPTPVPAAGRPAPVRPGGDGPAQSYQPSRPAPPPLRTSQPPPPPSMKQGFSSPPMRGTSPPPPPSISPGASLSPPLLQPADLGRLFDDIPAAPRPVFPTEVPGGATPYARTVLPSEQKTELARARVKATPTWMLACAAAFLGLMVVGLVFAVVSRSSTPAKSAPIVSTTPGSRGPFGIARAAYNVATGATKAPSPTQIAPPRDLAPPPPTPPPSATPIQVPAQAVPPEPPAATAPAAVAMNHGGTTATRPAATPVAPAPTPAGGAKKPGVASTDGTGDQGYLSVICLPACDQVLDNGKPMGPSPIFKRAVGVGEHKLKLIRLDPAVNKMVSAVVTASSEPSVVRQSMTP